jgi:hypothetical protein
LQEFSLHGKLNCGLREVYLSDLNSAMIEAKRRAWIYRNIDGLPALLQGATFILWGLFWLLVPDLARSGWMLYVLFMALWILLDSDGLLEWLRARITYPRTGYVVPLEVPPEPRFITLNLDQRECDLNTGAGTVRKRAGRKGLAFICILTLWLAALAENSGLFLGGIAVVTALWDWWQRRQNPPWLSIATVLLIGLLMNVMPLTRARRAAIILLVLGSSLMFKGATLLVSYIRQHPVSP